jgi:hypothetical protein
MVYALADRGAQLLTQRVGNGEWSRKNREAGRPFVDHQLEVTDFYVSLQCAMRDRTDVQLIRPDELIATFPEQTRNARNPLSMRVRLLDAETEPEIGIVPDFAFGLRFAAGRRRCFLVEIDRGTMPILRSDLRQTSFARKMHAYLAAYAENQHEGRFAWKAYRVLTVTTDDQRMRSMQEVSRHLDVPNSPGAALFLFATRSSLHTSDPLAHSWRDGNSNAVRLA